MVRCNAPQDKQDVPSMADSTPAPANSDPGNDRIIASIVYVLYLIGPANGFTVLIGVIIAFMRKDRAPAWLATHYEFQIRTVLYAIALVLVAIIGVFTVILIPLSLLIWLLLGLWIVVRCVVGLMRIVDARPNPDPTSFLV